MKKILLNLFCVGGTLLSLVSCSDQTTDPVASVVQNITLSAPATGESYVLSAATAGDAIFTVKYSSADFGFDAAVTYSLQVDKATGTFTSPQSFVLGNFNENTNSIHETAMTQRQLNTLLLGVGGAIGQEDAYKLRVVAIPSGQLISSANGLTAVSQVNTFSASAFDTFDEFDRIYVPGNYGAASTFSDWAPENAATLFSANNNGNYEGFVYMNVAAPEFKFAPNPSWGGDKGESSATGAFSGILGTAKNIMPTQGAGTYFFTVNWTAQTYTMAKRRIAFIGDATSWSPVDMVFNTDATSPYYRMYTKDYTLTAGGTLLIRLEDDWSVKMGTTSGSAETMTTGGQFKIKLGGGDMKVPTTGNYKIVLDIRNSANYNIRLMPN